MEAEQARTCSEAEHKKTAANYNSCISHMRQLEKKLKRSINKSRSLLFSLCGNECASLSGPLKMLVSLCVRKRDWKRHVMKSRCFMCWLCSVGVCPLSNSQGMWLLIEECLFYVSSPFVSDFLLFLTLQAIFWTESQVLLAAWGMYTCRL